MNQAVRPAKKPPRVRLRPVPPPQSPTLAQWLRRWLEQEVAPNRAATTLYGYTNIVERHLIPALGQVPLDRLDQITLEGYYRGLAEEKGLSANTVRKHHTLLHTSLQCACRQGLLTGNPAKQAAPPRPEQGQAGFYTPEQLCRLLRAVRGHPLELPVRLASNLGLRRSEILGLRWRDVDLHGALITVRQVRTTIGHRVVEKEPKTAGSCRTLSIAPLYELLALLRGAFQYRRTHGIPCGPDDFVVLNSRREPWHPNVLTTTLDRFVASRELPAITLHGLRHTFASMASNARVPVFQISKAMGHSSPSVTQRVYTHLFDPTHGEVLAAVAAAIPRARL